MDHLSPDGPVYQAGTLSGNPLAMAAGLAQLRELERVDGWRRLDELGAIFEEGVRATLKACGQELHVSPPGLDVLPVLHGRAGVRPGDPRRASDRQAFARFFHACLDAGVYFAPSQFEAGFISLAHTPEQMARVAEVATAACGKVERACPSVLPDTEEAAAALGVCNVGGSPNRPDVWCSF